ncbi:WAT1-related protein At5g40240-like isoform X2 [Herrania umbratica]|uniref:WAT1-related protein n=1 Tax=Herrania umbratica TaxID=108875 RepID=A0A6J1BHR4_9ROSI|nr:WAT1-related protein At5g40240-like isoform X2 [Herrania umbratica]
MARRYCYNDVLPFTAMVAVECSNVVQNILFKAASSKGMSYYIFMAYAYVLATLALLPLTCFLFRTGLPKFEVPLISRLCFLSLVGFAGQLCAYKGLELGSPTLSSAISNLTPAFTFMLAVFFRMEKVALRSASTRAKIIGTIASISGASVVVLYKGPQVLSSPCWSSSSVLLQQPFGSSQSKWVFGGLLLAASYLFSSFWYIIQAQIMKIYPEEMIVTFIYNLSLTILSVPVCFLAESNMSSWRPTPRIVAASILYSGLFALNFSTGVHSWGVRLKGPVYVAIFRPLSIVIAAIMSAFFLGDALYLGSVIGALILSAGLYAVLWGKAQEEDMTYYDSGSSTSSGPLSGCKVPFLQSHSDEEM